MNIHHLSASALSSFIECPMAFYGRHVYKWPEAHPPFMVQAMHLGSAVHKALEAFHSGLDPIIALCQSGGLLYAPGAFPKALGLVRAYTAHEQHDKRDICERKFELRIPGIDVPFIGYIDLQRGPLMFRDYKTTSSKTWWTQERADADLQMTMYALALTRECHGAQVTGEVHVLRHGAEFQHEVITTTRNKTQQEEGRERIRDIWSEIQKGELNAICKSGRCRFPEHCKDFGYVGTDTRELVLDV